jgi:STE24 endopeptidase
MDMRGTSAQRYSRIKYSLSLFETAYLWLLLVIFARTGWSAGLAGAIAGRCGRLTVPAYLLALYLLFYAASFPLTFYHSFLLERRFSLSTQKPKSWFADQLKSGGIAYLVGCAFLAAFYWSLERFPGNWWLIISLSWMAINLLLAGLAPVAIVPLFFKYTPVTDEAICFRILSLAQKMKMKVAGVFEIDMSAKTVKANAGLIGWGASRRVVIGDTLKEKYSPDEIEVILAHEFSHQKLRHLPKLISINALAAAACFYLIHATSPFTLRALGLQRLNDIASLPLVALYFLVYGFCVQPALNFFSRQMERNADSMALKATGLKDAFISTMNKLGEQNLSDIDPHPLIKFLFFDHPPIKDRINSAETLK